MIEESKELQTIFLIGAMKCGTTTLTAYLKQHPEICFAVEKEPDYFAQRFAKLKYQDKSFLELFNLNQQHRFVVDASTSYTKFPVEKGVPKRIFEYGLKPKFIYIVRDPFERIESHYNFMQSDLSWNSTLTSEHLINVSNYYLQITQYLKYFPKEDFLIVDFNDLKTNHEKVLNTIFKFINAKEIKIDSQEVKMNITKLVNRDEIKLKNKFRHLSAFLPDPLRSTIKKKLSSFFNKEKRQLTKKEKRILRDALSSDMKKFSQVFNFDVSKWGF